MGLFGHSGDEEVWENMAEGIFVVNKDGYIGDSTRSEIAYAMQHGKTVDYLEPAGMSKQKKS